MKNEIEKLKADLLNGNCDANVKGSILEEYILDDLEKAAKFIESGNYFEAKDRIDFVREYLLY